MELGGYLRDSVHDSSPHMCSSVVVFASKSQVPAAYLSPLLPLHLPPRMIGLDI